MGVYELIHGEDRDLPNDVIDGKNEHRLLLAMEGGYTSRELESTAPKLGDEDVPSVLVVSLGEDGGTDAAGAGCAGCSMQKKQRDKKLASQQSRLVSLDVFRGVTVVVRFFLSANIYSKLSICIRMP